MLDDPILVGPALHDAVNPATLGFRDVQHGLVRREHVGSRLEIEVLRRQRVECQEEVGPVLGIPVGEVRADRSWIAVRGEGAARLADFSRCRGHGHLPLSQEPSYRFHPMASSPRLPRMALALGTSFGPYEIRGRLGSGGMGEVYLAYDSRLRREVALKLLPADVTQDASARQRLLAEARLGARLDHPHICAIYEVGEHEGRDYIAMQRIPGVTLHERLGGRLMPEGEALALALQIADAVSHAHANGVIHRDLKTRNVMITPDGRAVVLDFGIARAEINDAAATRTATELVSGTPSAMSPEQARGLAVDARTDVFSFGAMLYAMLSGREPFGGQSMAETIAELLMKDPPPLATAAPGTSAELERIVHKC